MKAAERYIHRYVLAQETVSSLQQNYIFQEIESEQFRNREILLYKDL